MNVESMTKKICRELTNRGFTNEEVALLFVNLAAGYILTIAKNDRESAQQGANAFYAALSSKLASVSV